MRKTLAACLTLAGLSLAGNNLYADEQQCVPVGKWLHIDDSRPVEHRPLMQTLARQQVVLLGEDHENSEHHRWQLHTIAKLHAVQPNMAIGFEAFPRKLQAVLDDWVAGKLSEEAFLKKVDWENIWSYGAKFYLPMFHFARMHQIPMYALNVERRLISKVGQQGWENIPQAERQGVSDPAPASQDYIDALVDIFSQHMPGPSHHQNGEDNGKKPAINPDSPAFQRFLQSQLVWDRSMAEVAHQALKDEKAQLFVGVVGAGHIMGGYGIPHQLADLGTTKVTSLLPWDGAIDCEQLEPGLADYAFGMTPPEQKAETPKPRLGVYLEPSPEGVRISKLVKDSVAEKAGLQADDVILNIAGKPAEAVGDVVQAVQATAFGTWLPITVRRGEQQLEVIAKFPASTD